MEVDVETLIVRAVVRDALDVVRLVLMNAMIHVWEVVGLDALIVVT